ncbi:hypothetical protein [Streptomyces sp. 3N207]|uniref:hypothetical protein n=1 Tax=Streptomyces sp. 3N207 TaxID=3457417 RepID=UPI003FD21B90
MSTLALLVVLLLVLDGLMAVGALGYAVYRHPALKAPLTVAPGRGHVADRCGDRRHNCHHRPVTPGAGYGRPRSAAS